MQNNKLNVGLIKIHLCISILYLILIELLQNYKFCIGIPIILIILDHNIVFDLIFC